VTERPCRRLHGPGPVHLSPQWIRPARGVGRCSRLWPGERDLDQLQRKLRWRGWTQRLGADGESRQRRRPSVAVRSDEVSWRARGSERRGPALETGSPEDPDGRTSQGERAEKGTWRRCERGAERSDAERLSGRSSGLFAIQVPDLGRCLGIERGPSGEDIDGAQTASAGGASTCDRAGGAVMESRLHAASEVWDRLLRQLGLRLREASSGVPRSSVRRRACPGDPSNHRPPVCARRVWPRPGAERPVERLARRQGMARAPDGLRTTGSRGLAAPHLRDVETEQEEFETARGQRPQ
jgi:hypothetical protein